jgi:superfamily II DNA helicase RecQ
LTRFVREAEPAYTPAKHRKRAGSLSKNASRYPLPDGGRGEKQHAPKRPARTPAEPPGEIVCDERLFERLRALRRRLADERDVPAYIIFSDATLRQMARDLPRDTAGFALISGVGEKKRQEFARPFLAEIAAFLREVRPGKRPGGAGQG